MKHIAWTEQARKLFGLNHSTVQGKFYDYTFDIRYDYDGDANIEPENCGLCLIIFKNRIKLETKLADSIPTLMRYCENYLQKEKEMFDKAFGSENSVFVVFEDNGERVGYFEVVGVFNNKEIAKNSIDGWTQTIKEFKINTIKF